nr:MAG TPA: hypothetical protein [Caudoviricetes sp.]
MFLYLRARFDSKSNRAYLSFYIWLYLRYIINITLNI